MRTHHPKTKRRPTTLGVIGLCLSILLVAEASAQTPPEAAARPPASAPVPSEAGVPVTLDGEVVFYVHNFLGPFSPQERAKNARRTLIRIADDPFYSEDLFSIQKTDTGTLVFYRDDLLGMITAQDAASLHQSQEELASEKIETVKQAVARYRERRTPVEWKRAEIGIGVATVAFIGLLLALRIVRRRLFELVERRRRAGVALRLQEQVVIDPDRLARLEQRGVRLGSAATAAVVVILYLQTVFWFVPLTRGYALALLDYLLDPLANLWQGFLANVGNFFSILVILILARYFLKGLRSVLMAASADLVKLPGVEPSWAPHLYRIVRIFIIGTTGVMIYPYIPGSNTAAFKGLGILGGALLTVGASGAAGNFIAGLMLVFSDTFRIGDRVRVGETTGDVLETSMSLTRIRTPKNEVVTYPNALLLSGHLVNYSAKARGEGLILHTSVTIGYDAPWRKVHELLIQAALRTPGIVPQPAPFVLQTALNDFYITYEINAYTRSANTMLQIYGALHQNIQDAFNEAGVEIMSPHFTSLRDGNTSTVPGFEKSVDHEPRRFSIRLEEGSCKESVKT
ncbi:MAG TPA: mechanosensitive ion channel domain-containing protein [Myxococcota bacterium]|nr:mechanosensitive ion channel domain-containing protein [Myxococcota bacterium]